MPLQDSEMHAKLAHQLTGLLGKTDEVLMRKRRSLSDIPMDGPSMHMTLPGDVESAPDPSARAVPLAMRIERKGAEPLLLRLYPDRTYVFGRSAESTVVFPSDAVSRLHAQLRFVDDRWLVRDLNSSNGTFLSANEARERDPRRGGRQLGATEREVRAGETLILGNGDSQLVFVTAVPETAAGRANKSVSAATQRLERAVAVCATHRLPVFLLGASGSGKTFVARTIHERARMQGQFVLLNCGRLPQDPAQLTSELLGHVEGAFTGAVAARTGRLWSADGGTLFLDEVESLSKAAQDFLLDVLEGTGNFVPYGAAVDSRRTPPRFRLISASKLPLSKSGLRADLCQRLAAGDVVSLPTLAERSEDIPLLVEAFLRQLRVEQRLDADLSADAMRFVQKAQWPGEIRELESTVKVVVAREHASRSLDGLEAKRILISVEHLKAYLAQREVGFGLAEEPKTQSVARRRPADLSLEELEQTLRAHGGNKTRAAEALGVAVNTLKARLKGGQQ